MTLALRSGEGDVAEFRRSPLHFVRVTLWASVPAFLVALALGASDAAFLRAGVVLVLVASWGWALRYYVTDQRVVRVWFWGERVLDFRDVQDVEATWATVRVRMNSGRRVWLWVLQPARAAEELRSRVARVHESDAAALVRATAE